MDVVTFNGEHLLIGNLGHLFVVLSFVSALFGAFAFAQHTKTNDPVAKRFAQGSFGIHFISVLGIIVSLFSIIYNHYFEYKYAW
ncbi:MAG: hypothetical protein JJ975_02980, partial [Bacteroidia bacterium]|nr:hypothetical protein [Bacteroidia bacterium]